MPQPEQKIVALMKDLIPKFSKPGNMILDAFAGLIVARNHVDF